MEWEVTLPFLDWIVQEGIYPCTAALREEVYTQQIALSKVLNNEKSGYTLMELVNPSLHQDLLKLAMNYIKLASHSLAKNRLDKVDHYLSKSTSILNSLENKKQFEVMRESIRQRIAIIQICQSRAKLAVFSELLQKLQVCDSKKEMLYDNIIVALLKSLTTLTTSPPQFQPSVSTLINLCSSIISSPSGESISSPLSSLSLAVAVKTGMVQGGSRSVILAAIAFGLISPGLIETDIVIKGNDTLERFEAEKERVQKMVGMIDNGLTVFSQLSAECNQVCSTFIRNAVESRQQFSKFVMLNCLPKDRPVDESRRPVSHRQTNSLNIESVGQEIKQLRFGKRFKFKEKNDSQADLMLKKKSNLFKQGLFVQELTGTTVEKELSNFPEERTVFSILKSKETSINNNIGNQMSVIFRRKRSQPVISKEVSSDRLSHRQKSSGRIHWEHGLEKETSEKSTTQRNLYSSRQLYTSSELRSHRKFLVTMQTHDALQIPTEFRGMTTNYVPELPPELLSPKSQKQQDEGDVEIVKMKKRVGVFSSRFNQLSAGHEAMMSIRPSVDYKPAKEPTPLLVNTKPFEPPIGPRPKRSHHIRTESDVIDVIKGKRKKRQKISVIYGIKEQDKSVSQTRNRNRENFKIVVTPEKEFNSKVKNYSTIPWQVQEKGSSAEGNLTERAEVRQAPSRRLSSFMEENRSFADSKKDEKNSLRGQLSRKASTIIGEKPILSPKSYNLNIFSNPMSQPLGGKPVSETEVGNLEQAPLISERVITNTEPNFSNTPRELNKMKLVSKAASTFLTAARTARLVAEGVKVATIQASNPSTERLSKKAGNPSDDGLSSVKAQSPTQPNKNSSNRIIASDIEKLPIVSYKGMNSYNVRRLLEATVKLLSSDYHKTKKRFMGNLLLKFTDYGKGGSTRELPRPEVKQETVKPIKRSKSSEEAVAITNGLGIPQLVFNIWATTYVVEYTPLMSRKYRPARVRLVPCVMPDSHPLQLVYHELANQSFIDICISNKLSKKQTYSKGVINSWLHLMKYVKKYISAVDLRKLQSTPLTFPKSRSNKVWLKGNEKTRLLMCLFLIFVSEETALIRNALGGYRTYPMGEFTIGFKESIQARDTQRAKERKHRLKLCELTRDYAAEVVMAKRRFDEGLSIDGLETGDPFEIRQQEQVEYQPMSGALSVDASPRRSPMLRSRKAGQNLPPHLCHLDQFASMLEDARLKLRSVPVEGFGVYFPRIFKYNPMISTVCLYYPLERTCPYIVVSFFKNVLDDETIDVKLHTRGYYNIKYLAGTLPSHIIDCRWKIRSSQEAFAKCVQIKDDELGVFVNNKWYKAIDIVHPHQRHTEEPEYQNTLSPVKSAVKKRFSMDLSLNLLKKAEKFILATSNPIKLEKPLGLSKTISSTKDHLQRSTSHWYIPRDHNLPKLLYHSLYTAKYGRIHLRFEVFTPASQFGVSKITMSLYCPMKKLIQTIRVPNPFCKALQAGKEVCDAALRSLVDVGHEVIGCSVRLLNREVRRGLNDRARENGLKKILWQSSVRSDIAGIYDSMSIRLSKMDAKFGSTIVNVQVMYTFRNFDCFVYMEFIPFSTKSIVLKMLLNSEDIKRHIKGDIKEILFVKVKLIGALQEFVDRVVFLRSKLYTKPCLKGKNRLLQLPEIDGNKFRCALDSKRSLQRSVLESVVVGQFAKRFGKEYIIITVSRHIKLKHFSLELYYPRLLVKYEVNIYDEEMLGLEKYARDPNFTMQEIYFMIDRYCYDYGRLQEEMDNLRSKSETGRRRKFTTREKESSSIFKALDKRSQYANELSSVEKDLLGKADTLYSILQWEKLVNKLHVEKNFRGQLLVGIGSLKMGMKHSLLKTFATGGNQGYWFEVTLVGMPTGKGVTKTLRECQVEEIMKMDLLVRVQILGKEGFMNDKLSLREVLAQFPLLSRQAKVGQLLYSHLLRIAEGIFHNFSTNYIDKKLIKTCPPINQLAHFISHGNAIIDQKEISSIQKTEEQMVSKQFPILLSRSVFTNHPMTILVIMVTSEETLEFIVYDTSESMVWSITYPMSTAEEHIPFVRKTLVTPGCREETGRLLCAAFKNRIIMDISNRGSQADRGRNVERRLTERKWTNARKQSRDLSVIPQDNEEATKN